MGTKLKLIILMFLLFSIQRIFALDLSGDAQAHIKGEYNRSNYNNGEISLLGNVKFNNLVNAGAGFSYGKNIDTPEVKTFLKAGASPFSHKYASPLSFSLSYIFYRIDEFDVNSHSLFPSISYKTDRFGAEIGPAFRFTTFFGESPIFESILSFYIYCNFLLKEKIVMGLGCGTFNDFNIRNMCALWLDLKANIRINEKFTFMNELVWMQSGLDGLTSTFYGISYKGGVKFSWERKSSEQ